MPKIFICYARIRKNNCRAKTNRGMAAVAVGGSLRSAVSVGLGPVAIRVAPSMRHVGVCQPCPRTCRMPCLTHRWLPCPPAVAWPPAGRAGSVAMNHGGGTRVTACAGCAKRRIKWLGCLYRAVSGRACGYLFSLKFAGNIYFHTFVKAYRQQAISGQAHIAAVCIGMTLYKLCSETRAKGCTLFV